MMMNNHMLQMMMSGMSPMQYLQRMASGNPMIAQAASLIHGKTPEQLHEIAYNMAKQRGTTVEEIARQYGLPLNNQTNQPK